MQYFNPFVLPFAFGFCFVILWVIIAIVNLIAGMPSRDQRRVARNIFTYHTLAAFGEIFAEVLIHHRIWRQNKLLGFMHMSFAFGWFMLIVTGWVEASMSGVNNDIVLPIWCHIFSKFFFPGTHHYASYELLTQLMDLWLALILTGQVIAIVKRFSSHRVGFTIRPRHSRFNRNAMLSLWFIFPLRLLAESASVAVHGGGGFLTGSIGYLMSNLPFINYLQMPLWWLYSLTLGVFFFCIPFSRYLHIPIEGFLILFRHWQVRDVRTINKVETMACSACGMCLSNCPLARTGVASIQPVYFIERLRENKATQADKWKCLQCGRCQQICPVKVQSINIRQSLKGSHSVIANGIDHEAHNQLNLSKVVLYSGCMGRLTPRTRGAMEKILKAAGATYLFVDDEADLCCGRPLRSNGKVGEANLKLAELTEAILAQHPTAIVSTCPICYNALKNRFGGVPVFHHTDFIEKLIAQDIIHVANTEKTIVYHDPCELSRIAGIVRQPHNVLGSIAKLVPLPESGETSRCCGGALPALGLDNKERLTLADETANYLQSAGAEEIITACPLCKKTLAQRSTTHVADFAECVAQNLCK